MSHHQYMQRCLELAKLGAGYVAPNPLVGAVLVHDDRIIGEGWHQQYGGPHAEVNCINSVKEEDKKFISQSNLYVSLEPCVHHGKTPPCTDLIIKHKISKVVIGCRDPFKEVDGKGIERLKAAGVEVEVGVLEEQCKELNKRFFTFHTQQRPYIILKWAQTADGKVAPLNPPQGGTFKPDIIKTSSFFEDSKAPPCEGFGEAGGAGGASRLFISNEYSNRLVHKWRSEEASILVGTNTAMLDDPELTTRLWPGPSPVRMVVDMNLRLPASLKIFNAEVKTIIFNTIKQEEKENLIYYKLVKGKSLVQQMLKSLYELKIQSVLVEGGAKLLQSFIDEDIWDEARIINNMQLAIGNGLHAPQLGSALKIEEQNILSDKIEIYKLKNSDSRLPTHDSRLSLPYN
jgi:diaminohydroxyphosphoribosylaminopyrimidine deaminase / 5-amino-6-(5-phosphoribosylamino)uracil reductase